MQHRVIVNGANGKMGRMACEAIANTSQLELVASALRTDNLASLIKETQAEIVVDFTTPMAVYENACCILENGASPIIGTTGLNIEQMKALETLAIQKKIAGLIVPNFSIAAVLMMQVAAQLAPYFSQAEIIESHHPHKKDAPSGTAIKTAELMQLKKRPLDEECFSFKSPTAPQVQNIPIHSIRLPGLIANQEIIFGAEGETLHLKHQTISRTCFMPGLILACMQVKNLDKLYYGLEHILPVIKAGDAS